MTRHERSVKGMAMRSRVRASSQIVAVACGVFLAFRVPSPAPIVAAAADEQNTETCVRQIGDVTGDGVADLVISRSTPRNGRVTASLIAGPHDSASILLDTSYVR